MGASLGVVFAWFAGTWFVLTFGSALLFGTERLVVAVVIARVIGALVFAGAMTAIVAYRRRKLGGTGMTVAITRAIREGRAPSGADPDEWVPPLRDQRRATARSRWLSPVVFGLFAVLGIVLVAVDRYDVLGWIAVVAFVAIGIIVALQATRTLRRIDAVLVQLGAAGDGAPA